jgi:hypothetical protein
MERAGRRTRIATSTSPGRLPKASIMVTHVRTMDERLGAAQLNFRDAIGNISAEMFFIHNVQLKSLFLILEEIFVRCVTAFVSKSISSRLRPPGRNLAIFSPGLDVKRAWVGDLFQSHPGVRGYSFKIASSHPLHKSIAQSSAIGSVTIRRSKHKLD